MRCRPIKYLELTVSAIFTSGQITLFDWTLKIKLNNRRYLRHLIGYQIWIFTLGGYVRPDLNKAEGRAQIFARKWKYDTREKASCTQSSPWEQAKVYFLRRNNWVILRSGSVRTINTTWQSASAEKKTKKKRPPSFATTSQVLILADWIYI